MRHETKAETRLRVEFQTKIRESDKRLKAAIEILSSHERGRAALADFKKMMTGPASGLDGQSGRALLTLIQEYLAGRRDYLQNL